MKKITNISIELDLMDKLDAWAKVDGLNRSAAIERLVMKLDSAEINLSQYCKVLTYNEKYQYATKFSKESMDLILKSYPSEFKNPEHFVNKQVLIYANKAMNQAIKEATLTNEKGMIETDYGKVDPKMLEIIELGNKKKKEQLGIMEYDTEGNPIYE